MKITKFTRIVVPLFTGCALMLALSACMTVERANPGKSEGSSPVSSTSSSASPESSSASPTTNPTEEKQKNEEQSHEKQIVGLTDDNKAGKPRPRAEQKSQSSLGKNVKLKDDGSWTVEEGSGQDKLSVVVNVDGTFHVKRGTGSDIYHEMTINADGSWERIEKVSSSQTKTRVNADGTWRTQSTYETVYSTPDGKVYRESSSRKSEVSSVDKERYIYVPPQPDLLIGGGDGPGGGGVIPLTPRQPLQPGQQAVS